ncbi:type II asparaginase [Adhaeribacter terreus]|uniref:Type II asparaginase n=1 Tax=Adhaeribacter terreus TaxID=529703 RepID=A0ABW0E7I7_9BACT
MKNFNKYTVAILACALLSVNSFAQSKTDQNLLASANKPVSENGVSANKPALPNVVILATGGTIAGSAASGTQAGYTSGQVTIDAMVDAVPDAKKLANIKGEQISNVGSQDMSFEIMLKLANRINELMKSGTDGVVITHGTDTMEETAYFLNLVVKTDKPVVLVGSMRPSTAMSADGPLNLYNAISVAADPEAKNHGVMLVMNDWIHSAQSFVKVSTTAVQTFMSPMRGIMGTSNYGKNEFYRVPHKKFGNKSEFSVEGVKTLPKVDIVYGCVDMDGEMIDAAVKNKARGIVIAGVGNGNMTKAALESVKKATKKGVVVVRSTRVGTGDVGRDVEIKDAEYGTIASHELNPQKSRILLSVALLKDRKPDELQRMFEEY